MLTGEVRNKVDKIRSDIWAGGIFIESQILYTVVVVLLQPPLGSPYPLGGTYRLN
ncbi:hypothetical protein NSQ29_23960 [Paenibacillus sp. FSL F4-0236]|uniref:hypothetical protein n=1 Tax=Paenibacillus sp. FSL F4-0236 TaxID=2954731 RepID=UPI0030FBBFAB